VLRVEAPWVKHFYYGTSQYYILPNLDTVVLGGTTQKNNWDTNVSQEVRLQRILLPTLKWYQMYCLMQNWLARQLITVSAVFCMPHALA